MRDTPLHPQKPVLVEHISDDIRELRKSNPEQQKTVLTSRAIHDIFAGDSFVSTRDSDKIFFEHKAPSTYGGDEDLTLVENRSILTEMTDKIDLNRITEACIRYVSDDSYINGPLDTTFGGFIYTAADLPSGTLTWDDNLVASRGNHFSVRQILYPDNINDFESFTRIGRYTTVVDTDGTTVLGHRWIWSKWIPVSGRQFRILVTNSTANLLNSSNIRTNVIYELHLGGQLITLPDANTCLTGTSVIFEQYPNTRHTYTKVHSSGGTDVPNASIRYFVKIETPRSNGTIKTTYEPAGSNNGWLSSFEEKDYYVRNSRESWVNTIEYVDTIVADDGDASIRKYTTQTEATLDTIRTSDKSLEAGEWFDESESAVQYRFEVVDNESPITHNDGSVSSRTWMIDVDAEAIDRTADMIALLDSHTDLMMTDIVQYGARIFKDSNDSTVSGNVPAGLDDATKAVISRVNEPLVISRSVSMAGLAKFVMTLNDKSGLTNSFKVEIFKFNENDDNFATNDVFTYQIVNVIDTCSIYETYYTFDNDNGSYILAGEDGHLDEFVDGVTYYTRKVNYTSALETAKFVYSYSGSSIETNASLLANGTGLVDRNGTFFNENDSLTGYINVNRNDTIMVVITSDNHTTDMTCVSPVVEFYPDPHDSYIIKPNVSSKNSFTTKNLTRQQKPGTNSEMVAGAESVAAAYETIVSTLQKQGLMFGSVPTAESTGSSTNLNQIKSQGIYTLNSVDLDNSENLPSDFKSSSTNSSVSGSNATLVVMTSSSCDKENVYLASEMIDRSITSYKRISQMLVGNFFNASTNDSTILGGARIWIRYGITKNDNTVWSNWTSLRSNSVTINAAVEGNTVTEDSMKRYLAYGEPDVVITGNGATEITVNLPDPSNYKNVKFQIEAKNAPIKITFTKSGTSYTFSNGTTRGSDNQDRMLYPIECDGEYWYVITVS